MMKNHILVLFVILYLFTMNCSVQTPEFSIRGDKTMLENQILGTYEQIESDTWVFASTRSSANDNTEIVSAQRQKVLDAVQNRKFNKDEIDEFKADKVIGENNKGFLTILGGQKYANDQDYRRIVDQVVQEENRNREVIYERIVSINPSAAQANDAERNKIFAKLNIDNSPKGSLIQNADGTWIEKE